jgi:hypothetical protein
MNGLRLLGPFGMYSTLEETNEGDVRFLVWAKYATLEDLYDFLAEWPISSKASIKWKRIVVAREVCRREE